MNSFILQVAEQIFILHEECSQGNYKTVHCLAAALAQAETERVKVFRRQALSFLCRVLHLGTLVLLSRIPSRSTYSSNILERTNERL